MSGDYEDVDMSVLRSMENIQPRVIRNSAICLLCEEEIVSEHRHDFRTCSCGNLSVDGGHEYTRRVFKAHGTWKETSLYGRGRPEEGIAVEDGR